MARIALVLAGCCMAAALAGCTADATGLLVTIEPAAASATTLSASVTVGGRTVTRALGQRRLPGTLLVQLPDAAVPVTIALSGVDDAGPVSANVTVSSVPHRQVAVTLMLAPGAHLDGGLDGVPDAGLDGAADLSPAFDAASGDQGIVPSTCGSAGVLLCDGFEEPTVNTTRWMLYTENATASIDPGRAYRGMSSLHFQTNAGAAERTQVGEQQTFATHPVMYVRAFVFFPSPRPITDPARILSMIPTTGAAQVPGVRLFVDNGKLAFNNDVVSPSVYVVSTVAMPLSRWVCLEWEVDTTSPLVRVWLDGTEIPEFHRTDLNQPSPPLGQLNVVLAHYPGSAVAADEAWFDEVMVDQNPIGCAK